MIVIAGRRDGVDHSEVSRCAVRYGVWGDFEVEVCEKTGVKSTLGLR